MINTDGDFTQIHNAIIRSNRLNTYHKSLIFNLLSNEKGFKISISMLMERIPCGNKKVVSTINELKELNIVKVFRGRSKNNSWDINSYEVDIKCLTEYIGVVSEEHKGLCPTETRVVSEEHKKNKRENTNKNKKENNNTSSSSDDGKSDISISNSKKDIEEQIDQLWKMYPRKEGKSDAMKKLPKLLKQYGFEAIKRSIENYKAKLKKERTEKQYILQGSTFFNGRFIDYLEEGEESKDDKLHSLISDKPISEEERLIKLETERKLNEWLEEFEEGEPIQHAPKQQVKALDEDEQRKLDEYNRGRSEAWEKYGSMGKWKEYGDALSELAAISHFIPPTVDEVE